ncbi:MAG: FliH/SctL family protein [Candidatus Eremiobacter antarcticus]|nr:hypothetical protein [Candidatus Eremiobacteraeota bacterium]MBC5807950.1 hypothetical protein [Candidatus Eremiobacteraeota bacterium]
MSEPVFRPFVPRRVLARGHDAGHDAAAHVTGADDASADADMTSLRIDEPVGALSALALEGDSGDSPTAQTAAPTDAASDETGVGAAPDDMSAGKRVPPSLHAAIGSAWRRAEIRNEAVRLASIACGKAVRRGLLVDPGLLARFVDEALSDAQGDDSVVRLNPNDAGIAARRGYDIIADQSVAPGEFAIDTPSGTIGGTIEERAALLVLAASHA